MTQGTEATDPSKLLVPTVKALAPFPDLLIILNGKDIEETLDAAGTKKAGNGLAAKVLTAAFIPELKLLPYVGASVTNGGYNGVLTALRCSTPLACAGAGEDKEDVGARVTWAGVGIDSAIDQPTENALRESVLSVLKDPRYRAAANGVQDDFARHDGPGEAVDALEQIHSNIS